MRRWTTVLLLTAIVAGAVWTLTDWSRPRRSADPWSAIPAGAAVIIEINDPVTAWDRWTHSSQLWSTARALPGVDAANGIMAHIAKLAEDDPGLRRAFSTSTLLVALIPIGGEDYTTLFAWPVADKKMMQRVEEVMKGADDALPTLHFAWQDGLALIAKQEAIIDDARRTLAKRIDDPELHRLRATLGKGTDAHVVINGEHLPALLSHWFEANAVDAMALPAGWAAMDLRVRPEALLLSGVLASRDGRSRSSTLGGQGTGMHVPARMLPAGVCAMKTIQVTDPAAFLEKAGLTSDEQAGALLSWASGPVVKAVALGDSGSVRTWAVMRTGDPETAWRSLAGLCPDSAPCDTARYREGRMVRMGTGDLFERTFGSSFAAIERPWYTVLGDGVVFSADQKAVQQSIDVWIDGGSLSEDLPTADFFQRSVGDASVSWWCDVARSTALLRGQLKPAFADTLERYPAFWNGLGDALVQLSPASGTDAFISITLQRGATSVAAPASPVIAKRGPMEARILWSAELPAALARKPDILRNHVNGTREVLALDATNTIHLFSAAGQLLWSRALDAPIMGAITQVDRFNNGKLQMLFNTAGRVYLIDRNGKDLPGSPFQLKEKASAPLAVFDYEGKRDYRILLTTEEGHVLNLDMSGKRTEGWDPPALPRTSSASVRHLRIRGKDHLLVADNAGGLHVWDRRGADRYTPKLVLKDLAEIIEVRPGLSIGDVSITWLDTDGNVMTGTLDGSPTATGRTHVDHMVIPGMSAQGINLTTSGNGIMINDKDDGTLRTFESPTAGLPAYFDLGAKRLIGVVAGDGAHLLDLQGNDLPGSPFAGNVLFSMADLDLDGRFEVITANGSSGIAALHLP